jgi:O-antigen ligase
MTTIAYGALWIFIFSLPWENVISAGGVAIGSRLTGALALGIALITVAITGRFRRLHAFHVAALLFVIWAAVELTIFFGTGRPPNKFFTYVQLSLVLWMIWELARSWQRQLGLMIAYVFGSYVAAFDTFLLYHREAGALRRFTAAGTDPNDLAMTLALALPMAWYLGMSHRRPLIRWICRGYLPIGVVAIGLTGSRGGLLTTIVALLIVPLTMGKLTPGRLVTAILILAASAGLAIRYIPHTIVQRLGTTGSEVEDASFGHRMKLWRAGFHAFERRPFTGFGTGSFVGAITPEMGSNSNVAHNTYLSVLVEQGIVGLILYLMMFVAVYRSVRRLPKLERRFALTLLATLAVAILPLTWEDRKPVWFVLAALLGLSQAWISGAGGVAPPSGSRRTGAALGPRVAARRLAPLATPSAPIGTPSHDS